MRADAHQMFDEILSLVVAPILPRPPRRCVR